MTVRAGLIGDAPGWRLLMQQEGVAFDVLFSPEQLDAGGFSAVIAHRRLSPEWSDAVRHFVRKGGGLIATAEVVAPLLGWRVERRSLRFMVPQADSPFRGVGLVDVGAQGTIAERARWCLSDRGVPTVLADTFGDGIVIALPADFGQLVIDPRVRRKRFYMKTARLPAEQVSLVSKGEIRKIFHHALRMIHTERGYPYWHLWYFPDGAANVYGIRVDTDFGTESEVESVYRLAEERNVRTSLFLHVEAHERWLQRFSEMKNHEIGVHCYSHSGYSSYRVARTDLAKALEVLSNAGLAPVGVAAPYGEWSREIGRAFEMFKFLYSSEFSFDYDNLPSFPWAGDKPGSVLQVPIHPICIGSFRRCRSGDDEMVRYFDRTVEWKLAAGEPLLFYHHPKDGHPAVLSHLMDRLRGTGVPNMLLREFASWWKNRLRWKVDVESDQQSLRVQGEWDPGASLRIIRDTEEAIVPLAREIPMHSIRWRPVPSPVRLPVDIGRIRRFSPRLIFEAMQISWRRR